MIFTVDWVTEIQSRSFVHHRLALAHGDVTGQVGDLASFAGAKFLVFVMKEPGTRNMKVQVTFTPEGIAIQGDVGLGPTQHGICSTLGYGLGWWVGNLSEDYLAEKFLQKCWTKERAIEECKWHREEDARELAADEAEEDKDETRIAKQKDMRAAWDIIINKLDDGDYHQHGLYDDLNDAGHDTSDGVPGWGYDINDMGWLAAIQQAFKRLWDAAAQKDALRTAP